jgi:hypothetical protein
VGLITDDWVPSVSVGSLELGKEAAGSAWSVGRGGSRNEYRLVREQKGQQFENPSVETEFVFVVFLSFGLFSVEKTEALFCTRLWL